MKKTPFVPAFLLFWAAAFLFVPAPVSAQAVPGGARGTSEADPRWLRIELGKNAIRNRELGTALGIFRSLLADAQAQGEIVPEAEMWLGYIFQAEGELELARLQYLKALEHGDRLYIPEDRFTILYNLADIYQLNYQYGDYEKTLRDIISLGSGSAGGADRETLAYQESMYNALLRVGVDRVFVLYRKDDRSVQDAYSALGVYYYRTGLYRESLRNCLSALVSAVTNAVNYQRNRVFDYEFSTLEKFIRECREVPYLDHYLNESLFYQNLYYLGASLYALGHPGHAADAWRALADGTDSSNPWRDRTIRQLHSPFIEPVMSTQGLN